jgi:hypothetical protein
MENKDSGNTGLNDGFNNGPGLSGSQSICNVMYFHGTTTDGYRFTIAGVIEDPHLNLGISVCSGRDQFRKSQGRKIADERLLSQRNTRGIGKFQIHLYNDVPVETSPEKDYFVNNEFKTFTELVAAFNTLPKKSVLRIFNLRLNQK